MHNSSTKDTKDYSTINIITNTGGKYLQLDFSTWERKVFHTLLDYEYIYIFYKKKKHITPDVLCAVGVPYLIPGSRQLSIIEKILKIPVARRVQ